MQIFAGVNRIGGVKYNTLPYTCVETTSAAAVLRVVNLWPCVCDLWDCKSRAKVTE